MASREGAAEGGFKGGIPPRPSVPPERSGGAERQFRSKKVRAFSNKGQLLTLNSGILHLLEKGIRYDYQQNSQKILKKERREEMKDPP